MSSRFGFTLPTGPEPTDLSSIGSLDRVALHNDSLSGEWGLESRHCPIAERVVKINTINRVTRSKPFPRKCSTRGRAGPG